MFVLNIDIFNLVIWNNKHTGVFDLLGFLMHSRSSLTPTAVTGMPRKAILLDLNSMVVFVVCLLLIF